MCRSADSHQADGPLRERSAGVAGRQEERPDDDHKAVVQAQGQRAGQTCGDEQRYSFWPS